MKVSNNTKLKELWVGDFDHDGVANIDDRFPFNKKRHNPKNKEINLSQKFRDLEKRRKTYSKDIKILGKKIGAKNCNLRKKGTDCRVKETYSSIAKQIGRNIGTLEDAGGLTVRVNKRKDVLNKVNQIKKMFGKCKDNKDHTCIKEVDNKYNSSRKGKWSNPYGAVHVNMRYRGKPYEIQIKTNKFKKLSEAQHTDYKMGRDLSKYSQTARKLYKGGY